MATSANKAQLHVFMQALSILVLSCIFLKVIEGQGQDWPIVVDPFPDPDVIGPELPPPTPDCTYACQERVDEAMTYIASLQKQLGEANSSLFTRIINLERNSGGGGGGGNDVELTRRVTSLEINLPANVTMLLNKIDSEVNLLRMQLTDEIASLRRELEAKINAIPAGGSGGGGNGNAMDVYFNLTNRINGLEQGKIQNLINDNNLWRQNFRVVNATFAKLRKSATGNNVILTG